MLQSNISTFQATSVWLSPTELYEPNPRLLHYDKVPRSPKAHELVNEVRQLLVKSEARRRRRRQRDLEQFERQVSALVSELTCHALVYDHDKPMYYSRGHDHLGEDQIDTPSLVTGSMLNVIDAMANLDLITLETGWKYRNASKGKSSSIVVRHKMRDIIESYDLSLGDFDTLKPMSEVVLKEPKQKGRAERKISYEETPETLKLKQEVREINEWIAQSDINFDQFYNESDYVDITRTYLTRVFTGGSFDNHGRLCGAFWQELSKEQRNSGLTIDGKAVVCLDYSNMMLRCAYSRAGAELPTSDDLYKIPPYDTPYYTSNDNFRKAMKIIVSALFFMQSPMKTFPEDAQKLLKGIDGVKPGALKAAIKDHHQGTAHLLDTNIGHELWITESNLLIEVLRRLRGLNIVALPVHDCIIVPQSVASVSRTVMEDTCLQLLGVPGKVKQE